MANLGEGKLLLDRGPCYSCEHFLKIFAKDDSPMLTYTHDLDHSSRVWSIQRIHNCHNRYVEYGFSITEKQRTTSASIKQFVYGSASADGRYSGRLVSLLEDLQDRQGQIPGEGWLFQIRCKRLLALLYGEGADQFRVPASGGSATGGAVSPASAGSPGVASGRIFRDVQGGHASVGYVWALCVG